MYYIYILRCIDNSLYTGITKNIERRMQEHFSKDEKCAKYTKTHVAKKLEGVWQTDNRAQASRLEYYIKKSLDKKAKEELIQNHRIEDVLSGIIDENQYTYKGEFKKLWKDIKK